MNTKSASRMKRQAFVWALAAVMMTTGTPPQALAQSSPQTKPAEKSEAKPAPAPTSPAAAPPAPAPQTSAAKATTKPAPDVVTKVKLWVQEKWRQFRGMVPGTVAQRPVARPAAPAANAPAPALTGTVSGAKTQPPGAASVPAPAVRSPAQAAAQPSAQLATPSTPALTNLPKSSTGVSVYDIRDTEKIPRLDIDDEVKFTAERYGLGKDVAKVFERMVAHQKVTPPLLTAKEMALLTKVAKASAATSKLKGIVTQAKGKVSRDDFDKLVLKLLPEKPFDLKKYVALTPEELRFLSGLLLYQQGDKCPVAIGLFHSLAKTPKYAAEGSFYLAMCSKKIGLTTDFTDRARRVLESGDVYYSRKILPEVSPDLPYEFIEAFGKALQKAAAANPEIMKFDKPLTAGNIHYILANYGAQTGQFKLASQYGSHVPESHPLWAQAQFLLALGEYQTGSKSKALDIQQKLVTQLDSDKTKAEFQALVALNLARMYFQEKKFTESRDWFLKVYKNHPLWLQSLQELGWTQIQAGDYEGAIGNMYSVQSPYFSAVYKPDSYVVRTIGYLNICQYGDAYRTLTILERTYRPWLGSMSAYQKGQPDYMGTVRKFLTSKGPMTDVDGLPAQVVREMVRHKDYLNLQTSVNRQVDEKAEYGKLDADVEKSLARAKWLTDNSRKRVDGLRAKIASIAKNPQLEQNRLAWKAELENELDLLNSYYFEIDLYKEAKVALGVYKAEVAANADGRIQKMRSRIVTVLESRLKRMHEDLARILDNNELLRYEVFAGSGENIRFQVAGGEKGNRIPADVAPKSKTLQWDFDGEYWEDEVGHYRSSLKNNCPDTKTAGM